MNGYPSNKVNFSGVHCQLPTNQPQNHFVNKMNTDQDTLARIYLLFPQLRNQFVIKLREWKLIMNFKQPMASRTLVNHLTSLADHMNRTFLKVEILSIISLPLCYSRRVTNILAVIRDLINLLNADPNQPITDPEFIAGILGMILVQIGRLSISEDIASDEIVVQMDQLATDIDGQVAVEAYASLDAGKVREQKIVKDIWARMHVTDTACFCEQCRSTSLNDLMLNDSFLDLDYLDSLIADGSYMDFSADNSAAEVVEQEMDCEEDVALLEMDLTPPSGLMPVDDSTFFGMDL